MKLQFTLALIAASAVGDVVNTNLPATITSELVTNVVYGNNGKGCQMCKMIQRAPGLGWIQHAPHPYEEWQDITVKWTVTNVVRVVTVEVEWQGRPLTHTEHQTVSLITNKWRLLPGRKMEWEEMR